MNNLNMSALQVKPQFQKLRITECNYLQTLINLKVVKLLDYLAMHFSQMVNLSPVLLVKE